MLPSRSSSRTRLVGWKAISYQNPISQDKRQPIFPPPFGRHIKVNLLLNCNNKLKPNWKTRMHACVFFARQHRKKGSSLLSPPLFVLREPNINILNLRCLHPRDPGDERWTFRYFPLLLYLIFDCKFLCHTFSPTEEARRKAVWRARVEELMKATQMTTTKTRSTKDLSCYF